MPEAFDDEFDVGKPSAKKLFRGALVAGGALVPYEDKYVFKELDQYDIDRIEEALDLTIKNIPSRRQGRRVHMEHMRGHESCQPTAPLVVASHPSLLSKLNRMRFHRALCLIAKWNNPLGYNPCFAMFGAHVAAVVLAERPSFSYLATIYTRLKLDEYYLTSTIDATAENEVHAVRELHRDETPCEFDCASIWAELELECPLVTGAFLRFDAKRLFDDMVKMWLMTLLTSGHNPGRQSSEDFFPLIVRIAKCCSESSHDPRAGLRTIIVRVLVRHAKLLACLSSLTTLEETVQRLKNSIFVDRCLLEAIDAPLSRQRCEAFHALANIPIALTVGWFAGLNASWCAPTMLSPAHAGLAAVGMGAIAAVGLGVHSGRRFFQHALDEIVDMWDCELNREREQYMEDEAAVLRRKKLIKAEAQRYLCDPALQSNGPRHIQLQHSRALPMQAELGATVPSMTLAARVARGPPGLGPPQIQVFGSQKTMAIPRKAG